MEVLRIILIGGGTEIVLDAMEHEDTEPTRPSSLQAEVISELGTLALRTEATCQSMVLCIFRYYFYYYFFSNINNFND